MSLPQANPELLAQLIDEWQERLRKGERPELDEYVRKYPDLADEIGQLLPGLAALENLKGDALDHTIAPTGGIQSTEGGPALEQIGDFRILREVGRGGMGVVYEAEQISLGRHVALKVLPQKLILDARQKRRFEREAKAAAKLHHTNIVPVFGVGEYDGMPYYVMQFIQGLGLDAVTEEVKRLQGAPKSGGSSPAFAPTVTRGDVSAADVARSLMTGNFRGGPGGDNTSDQEAAPEPGPSATAPTSKAPSGGTILSGSFSGSNSSLHLPGMDGGHGRLKGKKQTYWQSIATIGSQVADALDYAHTQGILHRDIKPSNLLLDTRGIVWVTDFGLAKASDHHDDLTHTGDVLGTLRYMPPEAFEGRSDARGDIYALGLTLYEMLALQPAFGEKDRHRLVKQVTTLEPENLSRLNSSIPRDLVTVIHKAIDRDPARRYQTAREFANDLDRFLANEPILARRSGTFERTLRWVRRRPAAAALVGVSAVAAMALVASVLVLLYSHRLERAKGEAEQARMDAEHARDAEFAQRQVTEEALLEAKKQRELADAARRDAEAQREQAILSRGLLAVQTEQWPDAVKDLESYTRAHPDDLKAWLGLAKAQGRVGQPQKAVDSYSKGLALAAADNTDSRIEAHIGRAEQESSRGRLKEAIADYERAFQLKPDQVEQAIAFARTLYEDAAGWRVLEPVKATATNGVSLKPQPDGSLVPEGNVYSVDSFTIVARTNLSGIRAIRLETGADITQGRSRTGNAQMATYQSGNFILAEFAVTAAAADGSQKPVVLDRAWSDFHYPANYYYGRSSNRKTKQGWGVNAAIDGDLETGWSVLGQYGRSHTAVFLTSEPSKNTGETTLTIQIRFPTNAQMRQSSMGRFRLSVSAGAPTPAWECLVNTSSANGWVKLAAARLMRGETTAAIEALDRAEKQSGDQSAKQLLYSLVHNKPTEKTQALAAYDQATLQTARTAYGSMVGDLTPHWLAIEAATQWQKRDPTILRFRRARADALSTLEQWGEAIADYDVLIKSDASDYRLWLERGQCHARRGADVLAIADFAAAGKLNAEECLAWHRQKLQVLEYSTDVASSLPHLNACVALEKGKPGEIELLVKRGRTLAQFGRNEEASADFSRALDLNPNSADALLERGSAKAERGDLQGAKTDFTAARKLGSPGTLGWHSQQLNKYEYGSSQNVELALIHIGELIELDANPTSRSQYLLRRVYSLRQARRWTEAIADYDRIIALFPRQANYFVERADVQIMAGQREKGVADLSEALKLDRTGALQQIRSKVEAAEYAKDWRLALLYLDVCLKLKHGAKDEVDLLRRRGKAYAELGRHADAIADCDRIFALSPDDVEGNHAKAAAFVTYARDLRLQGKTDEAKQVAERARAFLKARAAAKPNDERFGVELVNFLLTEAAGWQALDIIEMKSAGGATLSKRPDGSILVGGKNPETETYSLAALTNVGLNAIRLEVLPDKSLPDDGPGRHANGNFLLSEIAISSALAASPNEFVPVRWRGAFATYVRPPDQFTSARDGPRGAIDGDPKTHWEVGKQSGRANSAMFPTVSTVGGPGSPLISIRLEFRDPDYHQTSLGCFRLAGSASRYPIHAEQIIVYPTGGAAQMAAALAMLGEREEAEAALRKSESAFIANDGGVLLLNAWTAELLGFTDRAKVARRLVTAWFSTKTTADVIPIPAVAIEVLSRVADDEVNADSARRWLARALDVMGDEQGSLAAFDRAIRAKPDESGLYYSRGNIFARQHKWKEAVADFQKMIELKPEDHYYYLTTAPIFLLAGDEDGYRKFRNKIIERFRATDDVAIAERMAKASSFLRGTPAEAKAAVELTQKSVASSKYPGYMHWFHLSHALTCYRSDNFGSAIENARLARERDTNPPTNVVQIGSRLLEALAQRSLGKTAEARRLLDQAEEMIGRDLPGLEKVNIDGSFHDWCLCKHLQREAELAIDPIAPPRERGPAPREIASLP